MTTWTPAQHSAIHHKEKNITVSASAGSGKTTILVERILTRVMQDKVPLDKILAMTFTEAAASEMKKRLFRALNDAKTEAENRRDDSSLSYLEEQLVLLQRAQISTIHSFCLSILQENYALIGFSLKRLQNIITDDFAMTLRQRAMKETIGRWIHDESFSLLKQYFSPKPQNQGVLEDQILLVSSALASMSNIDGYLRLLEQIYTAKSISDLPEAVKSEYFGYLLDYCNYVKETLDQMRLSYCKDKDSNIDQKMLFLDQLIQDAMSEDYSLFQLHFSSYAAIVTATCTESKHYSNMRAQLHHLDDTLASVLFLETTLLSDLRSQYPLIQLLVKMALTYREVYASLKEEEEVMDFDDMEAKALELLHINDFEIAKRYRSRFIDILVDEYQDSSYHQDELIRLIQNENNVFRVGDVKQSIYRFRGAVPDLLKGYISSPEDLDEVIHLRHNYRSNSQIIFYVNQLFEAFMNLPGYQKLFGEEDIAQVGLDSQMTDRPSIAMHILMTDLLKTPAEDLDDEESLASEELRAMYIANLIIEDRLAKGKKWSDYVILVRSHNRKNSLKRAFENANIPNFIDNKEGFYNASVIETMRAFFKVIDNPNDNLYFTALCLSRIYEFSDNDMAKLKLSANKQSFYQYASKSDHPILQSIVSDVQRLQKDITLTSLIRNMYQINAFYETRTTSNDRTNLDLLYEKAIMFEQDGIHTLSQFIDFTDGLVDSKSSEALSINTDEDVVRVMTIHQSKGLQFDTVIYWGKEQASKQNAPILYLDQNLGFGMNYLKLPMRLQRPTLTKLLLEHRDTKEEVSEEIRILYVALTRAKQQLFMITSAKSNEVEILTQFPLTTYQLQRSMRFGHWIANLSARLHSPYVSTTLVNKTFEPLVVPKREKRTHTIPRWKLDNKQIAVQLTPTDSKAARLFDWIPSRNQANIGVVTHRLIQLMDTKKIYLEEELQNIVTSIDSSLVKQVDYIKVLELQNSDFYQKCKNYDISKEFSFTYMNSHSQLVSGYIDFLAFDQDNKTAVIIDFKTDQHTSKNQLIQLYESQLLTYREAVHHLYPDFSINCYIYSLWLSAYIPIQERE